MIRLYEIQKPGNTSNRSYNRVTPEDAVVTRAYTRAEMHEAVDLGLSILLYVK